MSDLVRFMQDAVAVAFVALGVLVAINWLRRRDRSMGFLALAIILLAAVSGLGRLQAHLPFTIPLLGTLNLIGFAGSGYALLLYRNSLIPLPRRWHAVAISSLAAASVFLIAAQALSAGKTASTIVAVVWVLIWCACVGEPIVRFWLVARNLPAVQAWRLRSLSLGFGGLVAVLLFAISIGLLVRQPVVQVVFEVVVLAIVPLLYASFAPPTWLRRQWRAPEEEGLRAFMEELLLNEDRDALAARALEWATRLVGGAAAVQFDANRKPTAFRGLDARQIDELAARVSRLDRGVSRITLSGEETSVIALPVAGLSGSGTLVVVAGPFTPGFGGDEMNRTQQLMSAFVTALDRRHLMAQLEQRNVALQEANRHKSVFLANMSHELRTPLNAIIGFSELLTDAREGQFDDATRKRFLSQILTSGKHLLGLINDILDLSKVEAGQMELRLSLVSVAEAVDQVSKTVEPLVAKKNITLLAKVDGAGEVLADGGKLKQMLLNLVSNAIKFTPEDGTVTIDALRTNAGYRTEVARSGNDALERARQLKPAAITLDIIMPELDGWEVITRLKSDEATSGIPIVVVSVVDNPELGMALGAIDYFVKPVNSSALVERLSHFDVDRAPGQRKVRVLVVDDESANRTLLTEALEPAGFTVLPAAGGREAIEIAKSSKPDLVLLDLMMPEVNGYDVVEALRADERTRDTPIMVLTAANLTEADRRQLNGRVSQILSRGSVATSDIVGLLKRVVDHHNGGDK